MTRITNATRGTVVAERAVLAFRFLQRLIGLMFRREFAPFDALWLAPTSEIHMFWVRWPIDLIWLDADLVVVEVTEGIRPWRLRRVRRADSVLEVPAGTIAASGTRAGDRIVIGESPTRPGPHGSSGRPISQ